MRLARASFDIRRPGLVALYSVNTKFDVDYDQYGTTDFTKVSYRGILCFAIMH